MASCGSGGAKEHVREANARAAGLIGCTPLLPGDLFLATGTFQRHLLHGSLSYTEAACVDEVLDKFNVCSEAREVLRSRKYGKYFDQRLGLLPDRSVITFRRIENHQHGCPEAVDPNARSVAELVERIDRHF